MQYSLTNTANSCHDKAPLFQPIGTQSSDLNQFFDGLKYQTMSGSSEDALTVHDQQALTPHYRASTPVSTELGRPDISPISCLDTLRQSTQIPTDSGGKTRIDTCFGVVSRKASRIHHCDDYLTINKIITTPTCFATGEESKASVTVRLDSCATFLKMHNEATNKYLGLLNIPALCQLLSFSSIRLKAHMSPVKVLAPPGKPRKRESAVPGSTAEYNLRVVVEGSKKDGQDVGRLLSDASLFLQHPSALERDPTLEYFNPQFLLRPGESMPTLEDLVIEDGGQELRSKQLDDTTKARLLRVFDNANANDTPGNAEFDITPSSRLQTSLMP